MFATPVAPASFDGFEYSAIAISYNNHDMEAALDVNAFDGQSSCFVITPAGNLLFSATDQYSQSSNLLDWLGQIASFGADDGIDSLRSDIDAGQGGTTQFSTATNQYYLTYMPVGFQDWVMVGVVPSNVVNASMSEVQLLTIATVSVVLFALAALVVVILVQHGRRVLDQQVREVKYREQLFSALSGSTDNIFIMFSPDDGSVDYVSPNTQRILGIPAADIAKDVRNIDRSLEPGSVSLLEINMHPLPATTTATATARDATRRPASCAGTTRRCSARRWATRRSWCTFCSTARRRPRAANAYSRRWPLPSNRTSRRARSWRRCPTTSAPPSTPSWA